MGCKYCRGKLLGSEPLSSITVAPGLNSDYFPEVIVDDTFLYIFCQCGKKVVIKIKYCPICGRRLEE